MYKVSVIDMVNDIQKALDAEAYLSALSLSLTLPDLLAQVEYPELEGKRHVRERYVRWINEHYVVKYEKKRDRSHSESMNVLEDLTSKIDGNFIYSLRCSFVHSGSNDVSGVVENLDFELSFDGCDATTVCGNGERYWKHHVLCVPQFCKHICAISEVLIDKWKDDTVMQERLSRYGANILLYNIP